MKRKQLIKQFMDEMPLYYVTAADHPFRCACNPCATFLLDGILNEVPYHAKKETRAFLNEEIEGDLIIPLKDIQRFHDLTDEAY